MSNTKGILGEVTHRTNDVNAILQKHWLRPHELLAQLQEVAGYELANPMVAALINAIVFQALASRIEKHKGEKNEHNNE